MSNRYLSSHRAFPRLPSLFPADGVVYFARCREFVKIGFATDIDRRWQVMQTDNPYGVSILFTFHGSRVDEEWMHKVFARYHHCREWFRLEGNLKDHIHHVIREEKGVKEFDLDDPLCHDLDGWR